MRSVYFIIIFLVLAGCSSSRSPKWVTTEHFSTEITSKNLKLFNYTLVSRFNGNQGQRSGFPGMQQQTRLRTDRVDEEDKEEELLPLLESMLENTGYCKNGYEVLKTRYEKRRSFFRGECKDLATEEDMLKYVDYKITNQVEG